MKAIRIGHDRGDKMRMLKLPLILTDSRLYAGAIAQFYALTKTLEEALRRRKDDPMVARVLSLGYSITSGYEADLKELLGPEWQVLVDRARTPATTAYVTILENASSVELVAASFILYGALVIGGGKSTQKKVKRVFPKCEHTLFDVAEDMVKARRAFKVLFNDLEVDYPDQAEALVQQSARFMALNNSVVLSVRCLPFWWWQFVAVTASIGMVALALRWKSTRAVAA